MSTHISLAVLVPFLPSKDVHLQQNPLSLKFPRRLQFHTYVTAAQHGISEENPIFNLKWKRAGSSREEKNLFWSPAPHGRTMMRGKLRRRREQIIQSEEEKKSSYNQPPPYSCSVRTCLPGGVSSSVSEVCYKISLLSAGRSGSVF